MALELNFLEQMVTLEDVHGDITSLNLEPSSALPIPMVLGGRVSVASRINQLTEGRLEKGGDGTFPKPVLEVCVTGDVLYRACFIFVP